MATYQPPPPYSGYPPPPQPQPVVTTVVTTQPVVIAQPQFRDFPVTLTNSKGQQITTQIEYRGGLLMWIAVAVICLFTLELGLCCLALIPFCINDLKDVYHIDPTDGSVVGVYKRLS